MAVPSRPVSGAPIESAWGGVVHDTAVAMDIQVGTAVTPSTASGVDNSSITIVFARPFASPPVVVATAAGTGGYICAVGAPTATGFTLTNTNRVVGGGSMGPRTNHWIAYGPRA